LFRRTCRGAGEASVTWPKSEKMERQRYVRNIAKKMTLVDT